MSQLFAWGGQSTGVSALASFPPKKSQSWSPSECTGWIFLQSKGLSRVFSTLQFKSINSSALGFLHSPTLTSIHDHRRQLFLKEKSFYATRETKTKQTGFSDLVSKLQCPPPGLSCTWISRPSHSHDSARGFTLILCLLHPCQLPHKNIPKSSPTPRLRMPTN